MVGKAVKQIRATLIEMWSRKTPLVDESELKKKIYFNGENNLYPYEVETVIKGSPTAKRAVLINAKYISGKGVKDPLQDIIVSPVDNHTLSDVAYMGAESLAYHNGIFFHIGYGYIEDEKQGIKLAQKTLKVLDYVEGRRQKKDVDGFENSYVFKDWTYLFDKKIKKDEVKEVIYYPYNPDPKIVMSQIKKDSEGKGLDFANQEDLKTAVENYRGQVFYLNLNPRFKYAESPIDSVYNDSDSEYRFGLYTNTQFRSGFLGKTVALTQGLDEEQEEATSRDLAAFLGSENSGAMYHLSVNSSDDLDKVLKIIQLKPQFDDKLFESNSKRIRENILGAFDNIPAQLVLSPDSAMFGTSGEMYKEMKIFYSEQTEDKRKRLARTLTYLGFPCELAPVAEKEPTINTNEVT